MVRFLLVLVSVLALPGLLLACSGSQSPAAVDDYRFGEPTISLDQFSVTMVQYDSQADFLRAAEVNGASAPGLQAFSILFPKRAACEVHILRVADNYRPEWLGHEIAHCMHGSWHE